MFVPFKIAKSDIERIRGYYDFVSLPDIGAMGEEFYDGIIAQCTREDGKIDGSNLQSMNFPFDRPNYDVFISHSHDDEDCALFLYSWLTEYCGLSCFIDEVLWHSADSLLRQIDQEYCKSATPGMIDYEKSLYSSSHVHTMLGMSMLDAVNRSECCLFVSSDNSTSLEDGINAGTLSPWIYQEVQYINHIRPAIPPRLRERAVRLFSARVRDSILCESENVEQQQLKVEYAVDLSDFTSISWPDVRDMRGKGEAGLDELYRKYLLRKKPPRFVQKMW
ncbi:MAG: toll/interleukin-1 receptor domain-containing protein [Bacteroidaceae bacterium]|nr:toll/interleukin-1 receptor domain-containing protein [Bacteroidaceae bacterium]